MVLDGLADMALPPRVAARHFLERERDMREKRKKGDNDFGCLTVKMKEKKIHILNIIGEITNLHSCARHMPNLTEFFYLVRDKGPRV
ncbi:hypothetical protein Hanom_Chr03g00196741 [Helianthus anomalus]